MKLGIEVSEATVSRYMVRRPKPPSQTWRTFLDNHVSCLVSIDFFVVPTAKFAILFVFIVLRHERRCIEHFGVTAEPTAAWLAQQIREAFPWDTAPQRKRGKTPGDQVGKVDCVTMAARQGTAGASGTLRRSPR
jgi:hypothetical protein